MSAFGGINQPVSSGKDGQRDIRNDNGDAPPPLEGGKV